MCAILRKSQISSFFLMAGMLFLMTSCGPGTERSAGQVLDNAGGAIRDVTKNVWISKESEEARRRRERARSY